MNSVAFQLLTPHHRICGLQEGFAVRQGHLAPPNLTPDSPRPKNAPEANSGATLTIPVDKSSNLTKDSAKKASSRSGK